MTLGVPTTGQMADAAKGLAPSAFAAAAKSAGFTKSVIP
jgi:hypothetical protein